jgi:hypothetical protein
MLKGGEAGFACDCMCCGAARTLRAWGYCSWWRYGVEDAELIARALERELVVVTGDSGIMQRRVVSQGTVRAVFIPVGLDRWQQLECVLREIPLPRLEPRCMKCGGELRPVDKEACRQRIPPRTYAWKDEYWVCEKCGSLFWEGTHWDSIEQKLRAVEQKLKGFRMQGFE